ncbi:MAG: hypothetical protein JW955_18925 [Sedimentisphaerales bacterium]|nr:hypothetical protein [Sedimentisphaerales bacterium]
MWDIFDQPWTLLGAATIVLLAVLTFRSVWPEKRARWQWLLPVGVAVLGVGFDLVVATDLEKVSRIVKTAMRAAEKEDCVAIARLVAPNYEDSYHKDKQAFISHCRARLVAPAVDQVRKIGMAMEITPPQAAVTLTFRVRFEKESYWVRSYGKLAALVKVQVRLAKQPDASWLVTRVEVLEVDTMPARWDMARDSSHARALSC